MINNRVHTVACPPVEAKGFEEPVEVYRVIGTEDPNEDFGVIQRSGPGFSLWFDPEQASENNREDTLEFLKRAVKLMEGDD